ncbi:NUDIX domain-containing protein [Streptomyces sp. NPDC001606]
MADVVDHPLGDQEVHQLGQAPGRKGQVVFVGKSESGEPITETAVRELYEETGLAVKPESLKVAHIIRGAWGGEAPNGFLTVVFAADEWTGEPDDREPRKHAQVCWVDADALRLGSSATSPRCRVDTWMSGGAGCGSHGSQSMRCW